MKFNSASGHTLVSIVILSMLAACGGGGGDSSPPPAQAASVKPTAYTETEAKLVAGIGFLSSEALLSQMMVEQAFFANFLQGFINSSTSGSFSNIAMPCSSPTGGTGTVTSMIVKAGIYPGLKANDVIDVAFNGCSFAGTNITLNGRAILSPSVDYSSLPANFVVQYKLNTTSFSAKVGSTPPTQVRSTGGQLITYDATSAGVAFPDVSSTINQAYSVAFFPTTASQVADLTYTMNPAAAMAYKGTASNTFTARVDGAVSVKVPAGSTSLTLATVTPATGNVLPAGRSVPTSGVLRTKETGLNLLTETTVQGLSAAVKADSNGDGALDLNFMTTYTALTY
jgi:hypothetical protein